MATVTTDPPKLRTRVRASFSPSEWRTMYSMFGFIALLHVVGFFFSLGHSSVVFILTLLLGLGARALGSQVRNTNSPLHHYGGLIGTVVSGRPLYLITTLNLVILVGIVKLFIQMRQGRFDDSELEKHLNARGFMMRFFGPLARSIDEPWKMYP